MSMGLYRSWVGIFYLHLIVTIAADSVRVEVNEGIVEGVVDRTANGFLYKSFTGIPYAKPPIGELRFKSPVPIDNWEGVLDATKEMKICAQFDVFSKGEYVGEEDCLYLNVYVPQSAKKGDKLPVMFWVHGGGFACGSGSKDMYGPDHLIQHNVILVTINYRVGPLGFLYLGTKDAPGNMGLKDMVVALKWVNKNIQAFGGNPDNVTIFGQSAGGSATNHLIMSPLSKGLYKQAIMQSGTSVCEWAVTEDVTKNSFLLGEKLGLKTTDKNELVKFLREVPVEKLMMASIFSVYEHIDFAPVIETEIPNETAFFTKDIRKRLEDGDFPNIPIMIGCTSNEGFLFLMLNAEKFGLLQNANHGQKPNIPLSKVVPNLAFVPIHLKRKFDEKKIATAAKRIKEFYFPEGCDVLKQFQLIQSDFAFLKDIDFTLRKYAKHVPTYFYNFNYVGSLNLMKATAPIPYEGASHTDELPYMFSMNFGPYADGSLHVTDKDVLTIRRITEMWTNFAKYGNPTPKTNDILTTEWKPVFGDNVYCMEIGETLTLTNDPFKERIKFWEELENL